jgi:hypothetical protein
MSRECADARRWEEMRRCAEQVRPASPGALPLSAVGPHSCRGSGPQEGNLGEFRFLPRFRGHFISSPNPCECRRGEHLGQGKNTPLRLAGRAFRASARTTPGNRGPRQIGVPERDHRDAPVSFSRDAAAIWSPSVSAVREQCHGRGAGARLTQGRRASIIGACRKMNQGRTGGCSVFLWRSPSWPW